MGTSITVPRGLVISSINSKIYTYHFPSCGAVSGRLRPAFGLQVLSETNTYPVYLELLKMELHQSQKFSISINSAETHNMPGSQWESSSAIIFFHATDRRWGSTTRRCYLWGDVTCEVESEEVHTLFLYKHHLLVFAFHSVTKNSTEGNLIHIICHVTGEIVLLISTFLELFCFW